MSENEVLITKLNEAACWFKAGYYHECFSEAATAIAAKNAEIARLNQKLIDTANMATAFNSQLDSERMRCQSIAEQVRERLLMLISDKNITSIAQAIRTADLSDITGKG